MTARERFAADLLAAHVRLPLTLSGECHATILDADGQTVATIDVNRDRPDPEAVKIALRMILAVNTCGGYLAAPIAPQLKSGKMEIDFETGAITIQPQDDPIFFTADGSPTTTSGNGSGE